MVSQNDADGHNVTMAYDVLGRMTARTEADMVSSWVYGTLANQATYPNSIDKLVMASCSGTACASGGYSRTYQYDTRGRQVKLTALVGTATYYTTTAYDSISGKMTDTRAFSGFTLHYAYNAWGYQNE